MSKIKLTNAETGEVTELDLSTKIVSIRKTRAAIRKMQRYNYLERDGWKTTTKTMEDFMKGGVFKEVINGPIIEFTDKYGQSYKGILSSWHFEKHYNKVCPVITTTERGSHGIHNKFMISAKSITKGSLPEVPEPPKFK